MKVLVDTSVWSLMLRRDPSTLSSAEREIVRELQDIVSDGRASIIGAIRQELLSGVKFDRQFEALKDKLSLFDDVELTTEDSESAAAASNLCTRAGVATSSIDVLICAIARDRDWTIFTSDKGFLQFQKVLKFQLHKRSIT